MSGQGTRLTRDVAPYHTAYHTEPNPWACSVCGKAWPVPSLARQCEADHAG
jgi:hypothetical protein